MAYTDLLIHTCDVSRFTEGTADAYGNPVLSWSTIYNALPCRLMASGGREIKQDLQVAISDWTLQLESGVTITERDRVITGGVTYEVLLVSERNDSYASHHITLALQKVN